MHELFATVLAKRDLSRAGELFSIEDDEIVDGLTDVVKNILRPLTCRVSEKKIILTAFGNINNNCAASVFGNYK